MQQKNENDVRDAVLEAVEASLEAQLRAVRRLRAGADDRDKSIKQSMSQIDMVFDILKSAGKPLHVTDIVGRVERKYGAKLERESIVSALTKKVRRGDRFVRTDRNTFGLKGGR